MLRGTPFPSVRGSPSTLCRRCLLQSFAMRRQQARRISTSFLERKKAADQQWAEKAKLIAEGKEQHLWDKLKERGFIKDIAGSESKIRELMRVKRIGAYVGIDPTAPSLHIGHLIPLMPLFWMYIHGFRAVSVVGGATSKVGDPSDRLSRRAHMSNAQLSQNITKIHYQLKRIWLNVEEQGARYGYKKERMVWSRALLNNSMWYNSLRLPEIVSRLFRGVRLSTLLSRETVKNKMEKGDGMSLDELIYPMLQAWDFWTLFRAQGVRMQIGGSDQYGNIVSGVEAVKFIRDSDPDKDQRMPDDFFHTPVGFTTPLLTDSSGAKFGKTAGNAVWLDPFTTTPFDLYGYFMRRPDDDVERLLKLFTFLPLEDVSKIVEKHKEDPPKRHAQHTLAFEVVALVHGIKEAEKTRNRHMGLFSKGDTELTTFPGKGVPATFSLASAFRADIQLPESLILGRSITRILYAAGLSDSMTDANRLTQQQGAYVGGAPGVDPSHNSPVMKYGELTFTPVKNWFVEDTKNFLIDGKILILRRGKHFIRIIEMVSDEEWKESGKMYPGEPGTGRIRQLQNALASAAELEGLDTNDPKVKRQLLKGAWSIYERGENELVERDDPKRPHPLLKVEDNRAKQILVRAMGFVREGASSTKSKTGAIDRVLEKTRRDYEGAKREAGGSERSLINPFMTKTDT